MSKSCRQIAFLSVIPRRPHKISLKEAEKALKQAGFYCSIRTLQRDVLELEYALPGILLVTSGRSDDWLDKSMSLSLTESKVPLLEIINPL